MVIRVLLGISYVGMALLMALIIIYLPPVWKVKKYEIVAWPHYAAWGIGWVITGVWLTNGWNWSQYWVLFQIFHSCYPLIVVGAQLNHSMRQRKSIAKRL